MLVITLIHATGKSGMIRNSFRSMFLNTLQEKAMTASCAVQVRSERTRSMMQPCLELVVRKGFF